MSNADNGTIGVRVGVNQEDALACHIRWNMPKIRKKR